MLESTLSLPSHTERSRDTHPSLLPCGHVFGKLCLRAWLLRNNTCPVCRLQLTYRGCGHAVFPRQLTKETVVFTPPTIPEGGRIPELCPRCEREAAQALAVEQWMPLAQQYYDAKVQYALTGAEVDRYAMSLRKMILDRTMEALSWPQDRQW